MASVGSPQYPSGDPFSGGQQLGVVDFLHEGEAPAETVLGDELDGRMFTDLASLSLQDPATPTEEFYIRTRASKLLPDAKSWQVRVEGFSERPPTFTIEYLRKAAKPMGLHLMEGAGDGQQAHFRMISGATWAGVLLLEIFGK